MSDDPNNEVPVLDHDADGIQELDNLLPRWWVWLFWGCNVFAVGYMLYFHTFNMGDLQAAAYVKEYRAGKKALIGLFAGQVKKLSKGKAAMPLVNKLLEQQLNQ